MQIQSVDHTGLEFVAQVVRGNAGDAAEHGVPHRMPADDKIYLYGNIPSGGPVILLCGDICISLNEARLYRIAVDMFELDKDVLIQKFGLERTRVLPPVVKGIHFANMLNNYAEIIECMSGEQRVSAALELDDGLYKVIALLLNAEHDWPGNQARCVGRLDNICAYIRTHLRERIHLGDLELHTGLSRRSLQYLFLREFSCTPMQWIRGERLALAYQKLANATSGTRVTGVALSCGFDNLSTFSAYFKKRFGLLPNQILSRGGGKDDPAAPLPVSNALAAMSIEL